MFRPDTIYAKIAYDAILMYVKTGQKIKKEESEIPPALKLKLACFVSIYENKQKLRGCIGSAEPVHDHLYNEIIENAIAAATSDPRFKPLAEEELNDITITVDVLSVPKKVEDMAQLKPHKHGIIIEDDTGKKGLLLPNLDGVDSTEKQIEIVKKKAGIDKNKSIEDLNIQFFTTTRYK